MALGEVAIEQARYDAATACFGRAAQRNPGFSTAWKFQGMATALAGREDARPMIRRGLELEPGYRAARGFCEKRGCYASRSKIR
jgi:hypothetical protein